jgi:undecaprenyl-diphosphatase
LDFWEAIILGIVEGLTEFLPISSTGHLTILEKVMGFEIDDPDITAFTAIIQSGAVLATLLYLRGDIVRILTALASGVTDARERGTRDFRFGIAVAVGCIPIAIVGLAFKDQIETTLRSLWFVGGALIVWSGAMYYADVNATQERGEDDVRTKDTLIIGIVQCLALVPGVSRSGATMSAGLLRGLDRVTVTRLSFFLSIPALTAAGLYELKDALSGGVGAGATIVGTLVAFLVAYASIAWLLRFVAHHSIAAFVPYRVAVGVIVIVALSLG